MIRARRVLLPALPMMMAACSVLRPLPSPPRTACPPGADIWACIGEPDHEDRESGFTSTMRIASTDPIVRFRNQHKKSACDRNERKGFARIDWPAEDGRAPLAGYFHEGSPSRPIIIVLHGLYDSNASRYVRITADALAKQSYGVLLPDMRWHGCLLDDRYLSTLGVEESQDLLHWAKRLRERYHRPVGAIGYSLGGLTVVLAMEADANYILDRGAIAISPPANLATVFARLDREPSLSRDRRAFLFLSFFRKFLGTRLREMGVHPSETPFSDYVKHLGIDVVTAAEPKERLTEVRGRLLIVTAEDDPILGSAPAEALVHAPNNPNVRVIVTRDGGHIGHLGRYRTWLSATFARFFSAP